MRLSSQDWSGVRCSVVTSSKTRVDWGGLGGFIREVTTKNTKQTEDTGQTIIRFDDKFNQTKNLNAMLCFKKPNKYNLQTTINVL